VSEPGPVVHEGLPDDPESVALTVIAIGALRDHLQQIRDEALSLGVSDADAITIWRRHWGEIVDSLAAEIERGSR